MNNIIYFDNAATTIPCKAATDAAAEALLHFGNPSSTHTAGMDAKRLLNECRSSLAVSAGAKEEEIFFTASGTESNNTAIFGAVKSRSRFSKVIVTTDSEHPSVKGPIGALETEGYKVIRLSTKGGAIDEAELKEALSQKVALVSIMHVNNETGAVYDLKKVREMIDSSKCGALFHSDDVQGFMKTPLPALRCADIVSASAHKINGIRGAGLLYIKSGVKLPAYILGGGQEKGIRSGTENLAAIAAFSAAAAEWKADKKRKDNISKAKEHLKIELSALFGEKIYFNEPKEQICSILSISLPPLKSEVALNALSAKGICVSASSACSSKKADNPTLAAFGLTKEQSSSALRIGLSYLNTEEEASFLANSLKEIYEKCIK